MSKDINVIPNGMYCYNEDNVCPYFKDYGIRKIHINPPNDSYEQCENNDCSYKEICWQTEQTCCQYNVVGCDYLNYLDKEENSLLWDMVKECGINE